MSTWGVGGSLPACVAALKPFFGRAAGHAAGRRLPVRAPQRASRSCRGLCTRHSRPGAFCRYLASFRPPLSPHSTPTPQLSTSRSCQDLHWQLPAGGGAASRICMQALLVPCHVSLSTLPSHAAPPECSAPDMPLAVEVEQKPQEPLSRSPMRAPLVCALLALLATPAAATMYPGRARCLWLPVLTSPDGLADCRYTCRTFGMEVVYTCVGGGACACKGAPARLWLPLPTASCPRTCAPDPDPVTQPLAQSQRSAEQRIVRRA